MTEMTKVFHQQQSRRQLPAEKSQLTAPPGGVPGPEPLTWNLVKTLFPQSSCPTAAGTELHTPSRHCFAPERYHFDHDPIEQMAGFHLKDLKKTTFGETSIRIHFTVPRCLCVMVLNRRSNASHVVLPLIYQQEKEPWK